jgi:hypothetical protein
MQEPHMFTLKADHITLQLAQWGTAEECLLCVHGMT